MQPRLVTGFLGKMKQRVDGVSDWLSSGSDVERDIRHSAIGFVVCLILTVLFFAASWYFKSG